MKRLENGLLLFSPSDLIAFIECRHCSLLSRAFLDREIKHVEPDANLILLQKKGLEHEYRYREKLKSETSNFVEIPRGKRLIEKSALSLEAMQDGADVIYQAVFYQLPWRGDADFLIKCSTPSNFGSYSYEVIDTKLTRTAAPKHLLQLCAYSDYLSKIQGVRPKNMHLVLGDGERYTYKVDDFFFYYMGVKNRFESFMRELDSSLNIDALPMPNPCPQCDFCNWALFCKERWVEEDHLSLVANIQRGQIDKLNRAGIKTLAELAGLSESFRVPNIQRETLLRLNSQAALQYEKRKTNLGRVLLLPEVTRKGFSRLPQPNKGDLFFDMEGDPYYPDRLEYLFGVYDESDGPRFIPFWGHSHEEEKKAFCEFMKFIGEHLAKFPDAFIYHYNHYETTALKRLACRYAVCEEQLDILLRQGKFIDLYVVVRESMRTSEPGYSIKNLETFYMKKRDNSVGNAAESIVVYNLWRENNDPALLKEIADYNEVDCVSTCLLRNWLLEYRPQQLAWHSREVKAKEAGAEEIVENARKPWEIEYEQYCAHLMHSSNPKSDELIFTLLSFLLEFHRREGKPQWWNFFSRQEKTDDELLNDLDCIAGLCLVGEPVQVKKALVYTYSFPQQEFKIKEKDSVVDVESMNIAGTVIALDERKCILKLSRGSSKRPLPEYMHIGPQGPMEANTIREALYRYTSKLLEGNRQTCGEEILRCATPKMFGRKLGLPIVAGVDVLSETIEAVASLDNSYLFIQGPPGAGKTYVSSHVIVELMRRGKTIGVSSNSHKAIHNLLEHVEKVAKEKGVTFSGVKKCTNKSKETYFEGASFRNISSTSDIERCYNLYAGTVWFFANKSCDGLVDYLFIDEAGQVALANVIAMSCAAKNIILVGDQMQLGQPTQGTHPGKSGHSVLEYLLGDKATIPPDRGVFLAETRRISPTICKFISEAFYDGELASHPDTAKRKVTAKLSLRDATSLNNLPLPCSGLVMVEAEHSCCTQKSIEEASIVKELYSQLLKGTFQDKNGAERSITPEDILVVSPYNMQVNLLESMLCAGARVGTVDKFQGQEAPVVIFSMTTSSGKDLTRNMEFLFSKNRLNVAISRAQCLAIVVANPLLTETYCNTIEQMRLVNTFCKLYLYEAKGK